MQQACAHVAVPTALLAHLPLVPNASRAITEQAPHARPAQTEGPQITCARQVTSKMVPLALVKLKLIPKDALLASLIAFLVCPQNAPNVSQDISSPMLIVLYVKMAEKYIIARKDYIKMDQLVLDLKQWILKLAKLVQPCLAINATNVQKLFVKAASQVTCWIWQTRADQSKIG